MEFIWILFAFVCGLSARALALPPLIGYLIAGFILHFMGIEASEHLETLAQLGITLMLFTIGLKLDIKGLIKPEVWLGAVFNMSIFIAVTSGIFMLCVSLNLLFNVDLKTAALIAFALSFSSTVCVVKILEESGEIKSRHGKLAIGILVMQDIVAVAFMVAATGKTPSIWALALFLLIFARKPIEYFLERVGHGELLPLMGFFAAFGGYEIFELVGVKGDLGALVTGVLLNQHKKSAELYKSLMSFKDLFLIGFFLSIGFTALPDMEMVYIALFLVLLIPIKSVAFFWLFSLLKLRARTAFLSSLVLSNYSEFGLIVTALTINFGWIENKWLIILALASSFSFIFISVTYRYSHTLYRRYKSVIARFEPPESGVDDTFVLPRDAEILIIGMGRVGKGTYHTLCKLHDSKVWGMDSDEERSQSLSEAGLRVLFGDAEDVDLWQSQDLSKTKLVLIALPYIQDIKNISAQLRAVKYQGKVAAIARYEDQVEQLKRCGIDRIFNFYTEAGVGFAEESYALIDKKAPQ